MRWRLDGVLGLVLVDWGVATVNFVLAYLNLRRGDATWAVVHAVLGGLLVSMGSMLFSQWLVANRR